MITRKIQNYNNSLNNNEVTIFDGDTWCMGLITFEVTIFDDTGMWIALAGTILDNNTVLP